MQYQKAAVRVMWVFLILSAGVQATPLQAFEKLQTMPKETRQAGEVAGRDRGTCNACDRSAGLKRELAKTADRAADRAGGEATASELDAIREQMSRQQSQIEELQAALETQRQALESALRLIAANANLKPDPVGVTIVPGVAARLATDSADRLNQVAPAAAGAAAPTQDSQRLAKLEAEVAANKKEADARVRQIGNFNFGGDLRVRWEPFLQEGAVTRNRERVRARLNITGKLSDEFSGGISLATGSLDDPISTNQTLTGFFNRKQFGIDRAWITYKPAKLKYLKLDAGKFAYPWYRTSMTFDPDVNPEGFAETLSFDLKHPVLKNVALVGFQLPFNELSGGYDSFIFGGQLQGQLQLSSRVRLGLYAAGININRADAIALALNAGTLNPSLPNSNSYRVVNTKVVGYAVKFAYLDAIARLDIDTGKRFPTTLQFDFVNNTRGSRERSGYWADVIFGRQREVRDWQFTYSFVRIEKDAVIAAFNESDIRSSTNVRNHRIMVGTLLRGNVTAQFTSWIGRLANPLDNINLVPSGVRSACAGAGVFACRDPHLKRLQFDLTYRF